ncbi:MAG TPA: glycerophosphodiester phosphodiesterase [Dissulfurispiraceae bacterium]|nr:glycerophosphodiester phosphodiesterase [Dissulfurispiraceae bacterium]
MFLKIGHRGARAYEIENTIASFRKAIELGVNAIEFDVRMSGDGIPVVIHDDGLKRVFGADLQVRDGTVEELKRASGQRIPTLSEAFRFIGGKTEKILVELKESGYEEMILDTVLREGLADRVILISFLEESLERLRILRGDIDTGLIYKRHGNPIAAAAALKAHYLLPLYRIVRSEDVQKAHGSHLKVIAWTINSEREAYACAAKGVDGIASDKPDILKGLS